MIICIYFGIGFLFLKLAGLTAMPWLYVFAPFLIPVALTLGWWLLKGLFLWLPRVSLPGCPLGAAVIEGFKAIAFGGLALGSMYGALAMTHAMLRLIA